jgi:hypothetical protein
MSFTQGRARHESTEEAQKEETPYASLVPPRDSDAMNPCRANDRDRAVCLGRWPDPTTVVAGQTLLTSVCDQSEREALAVRFPNRSAVSPTCSSTASWIFVVAADWQVKESYEGTTTQPPIASGRRAHIRVKAPQGTDEAAQSLGRASGQTQPFDYHCAGPTSSCRNTGSAQALSSSRLRRAIGGLARTDLVMARPMTNASVNAIRCE